MEITERIRAQMVQIRRRASELADTTSDRELELLKIVSDLAMVTDALIDGLESAVGREGI